MRVTARSLPVRYGIAALAVALATAARLALDPLLGDHFLLFTYLLALLIVAWQGGLGPSLLALAMGGLAIPYFFYRPRGAMLISGPEQWAGLVVFFATGAVISLMGGAMRSSRDRAERAAREALDEGERLRITLASIGEAVITVDAAGRVGSLNPVAEALTGWASIEAQGRDLGEVFHIQDEQGRRPAVGPVEKALRAGGVVGTERPMSLISRGGDPLPIEHNAAPIRESRGAIMGAVLVFRDATAARREEHALRASEERFRSMADAAPVLIWVAGADRSCHYFNKPWLDFTGRTPEEAGAGWAECVHPDDLDRRLEVFESSFDARRPFAMEYRLRRRDGEYRWLLDNGSPWFADGGGFVGYIGSCVDITDLKRTRDQLVRLGDESERNRRIYETTLANTADMNYVFDPQARFVFANPALLTLLGRDLDGVRGRGFRELDYPPELADRLNRQIREVVEARRPVRDETPFTGPGGSGQYEYIFVPVFAADGSVEAVAGATRDITDRKRMEETLREQAEQLKEADRRKDDFLATLAHELRNPLAPIRNALHLMRGSSDDPSSFEPERAMVERQVIHLARLVDDLLDVARISRGKIELRKEVLELTEAVSRVVQAIQTSIEGRGHALSVSLPDAPIYLEADPTRLDQVLWNLLSNASKYTEPGGRIRLEVGHEGGQATIRVRDSGIGIEPGMLSKVFEIFVRAEDRAGRLQEGLGIGLSLARTLAELHGGGIDAHSEGPGAGSEFVVRLPALPAASKAPEPESRGRQGPAGRPPRRRVLVVDDNEDAARSLAKLLSKVYGQEVQIAHDGPSALEIAAAFRPELILMDIGMPGMDGYEVARRLRRLPEFAATPIVALTGWGQDSDRRRSKDAGFDRHLVKPVSPEVLRETLSDAPDLAKV